MKVEEKVKNLVIFSIVDEVKDVYIDYIINEYAPGRYKTLTTLNSQDIGITGVLDFSDMISIGFWYGKEYDRINWIMEEYDTENEGIAVLKNKYNIDY